VKTIGNDNKDKDSYTLGQQIIIIVKTLAKYISE